MLYSEYRRYPGETRTCARESLPQNLCWSRIDMSHVHARNHRSRPAVRRPWLAAATACLLLPGLLIAIVTASPISARAATAPFKPEIAAASVAPPSHLKYARTTISGTIGKAISPDTPTVSGKVSSSASAPRWSPASNSAPQPAKSPVLRPHTTATPPMLVTAKNSAGSTKADVIVCVLGLRKTLLELGHANSITGAPVPQRPRPQRQTPPAT